MGSQVPILEGNPLKTDTIAWSWATWDVAEAAHPLSTPF